MIYGTGSNKTKNKIKETAILIVTLYKEPKYCTFEFSIAMIGKTLWYWCKMTKITITQPCDSSSYKLHPISRLDVISLLVDCILQASNHTNLLCRDSIHYMHVLWLLAWNTCSTRNDIMSTLEVDLLAHMHFKSKVTYVVSSQGSNMQGLISMGNSAKWWIPNITFILKTIINKLFAMIYLLSFHPLFSHPISVSQSASLI